MATKLYKKLFFEGTLKCLTGLHIGDSKDSVDIGGVDSPVVRRKDNNQPYIPGSSLKGKMRCLLEQVAGENPEGKSRNNGGNVCLLFGGSEDSEKIKSLKRSNPNISAVELKKFENQPSRLIVRDAYLSDDSVTLFEDNDFTDMPFTEIKFENTIDRIKGTASNPRQFERVPAGAIFEVKFVINVFANSPSDAEIVEANLKNTLKDAIDLINNDYLGGSGSRGYGHVKIIIPEQPQYCNYATT